MKRLGIIGGGHLGIALAKLFLLKGHERDYLRISLREVSAEKPHNFPANAESLPGFDAQPGSVWPPAPEFYPQAASLERLAHEGLLDCYATNRQIAEQCEIVLLAVRPSDVAALGEQFRTQKLRFGPLTKVLSPVAGWERQALSTLFGHPVYRTMLSGAPGIEIGEGVCAIYPEDGDIYDLFGALGLRVFGMNNESLLHIFTAGVCLTAAFLQAQVDKVFYDDKTVITHFEEFLPDFGDLYQWAKATTPHGVSNEEAAAYIARLATKGGITERIVAALHEGADMVSALERGVAWSEEIAGQAGGIEHEFKVVDVTDDPRQNE